MVIQVLNPKLGIALRVSVTSATILTAKRTIHKNTFRQLRTMTHTNFKEFKSKNYVSIS